MRSLTYFLLGVTWLIGCGAKTSDDSRPAEGQSACALSERWTHSELGGYNFYHDTVELLPPFGYHISRSYERVPARECTVSISNCEDMTAVGDINIKHLTAALSHPDVLKAVGEQKPPFYGRDTRPMDGSLFELKRADGRGFVLGDECRGDLSCNERPTGLVTTRNLLEELRRSVLKTSDCAALAIPP